MTVKSTVENLSPTRVRLAVEVPFEELKTSMDKAYREIGGQVQVPGFRRGKVPPRIIDQRFGRAAVLEQAVNEAIPEQYSAAVREHDVKVMGQPEVDVTELDDGKQLSFTAEVDIRPDFELPDYSAVEVTVDDVAVPEADIEEQVDALRQRFATLTGVERPVADGDYVTLDLQATVDGADIDGGTTTGQSYEVGSGNMIPGLDEALVEMSVGDAKTFQTELMGEQAGKTGDIAVTVRSVKEKELPALDDDFAQTASEFDTLDELREDVRTRMAKVRSLQQGYQARDKVLEALLSATEVPLPESVVENETGMRRHSIEHQLSNAGLSMDAYLQHEGKTPEELSAELAEASRVAVKAQLVLDAIADKEEVGVSDSELTDELVRRAQQEGVAPQEFAQQLMNGAGLPMLVSDVRRGKALADVLQNAVVRDESGAAVDLDKLSEDAEELAGAAAVAEAAQAAALQLTDEPVADDAATVDAVADDQASDAADQDQPATQG